MGTLHPMHETNSSSHFPGVTVVGPGAVGSYFGGMLARAGAPVTFLGRPGSRSPHLAAVEADGLTIDGVSVRETVGVAVRRDPACVEGSGLVLFAVKTTDTARAAGAIAQYVDPATIVVSLQNGVGNEQRLAEAGVPGALPSVVYVAAEIERPGAVRHRGRGDLILDPGADTARATAVAGWFERAGVPCPVSPTFAREQWSKLIMNTMGNAISALTRAPYAGIASDEAAWNTAVRAAHEAVAVAHASGVVLDVDAVIEAAHAVSTSVGDATSSMEQDLARDRPTEIASLNGFVAERGAALGVPTPTHDTLAALVGLYERTARAQRC